MDPNTNENNQNQPLADATQPAGPAPETVAQPEVGTPEPADVSSQPVNASDAALPLAATPAPQAPSDPAVNGLDGSGVPAGAVVGAPVTGGDMPPSSPPSGLKAHKGLVLGVAAVLVLGLGAAAYYFGYYTNSSLVYSQSLADSGKAYDKLVNYFNKQDSANYKGATGSGSYKFTSGTTSTDGKLAFKSDGANSDTSFDVGLGVSRVSVDVRTIKPAGQDNPDLYLKADGITGLGALTGSAELSQTVDQLNGKWIAVDHTLLDNIQSQVTQSQAVTQPPTRADIMDEVQAFGQVNKQYVFTTKKDKAVTTVVKTYGRETVSGHKTYHYKVALVKTNVKQYITAQRDALNGSKLGAWLKKNNYQADVNSSYASLEKSADSIKPSDTFDVWSDINTRLVYKVRMSDTTNPATNYVDVGLDYKKGDTYPFFISGNSKDGSGTSSGSVVATLDGKTNVLSLALSLKSEGSSPLSLTGNFSFKPSNDAVKVAVPTGAVSLSQVLDQLGLGGLLDSYLQSAGNSSTAGNAKDSKRQVDIQSLQTQLEAFFAQKGYYPSLSQLNDANWRKTNMPSLDPGALQDPDGTAQTLAAAPAAHVYAYQAKGVNGVACDNSSTPKQCASYTLTATLSTGSAFTKTNLN